ncbi:DNA mismatch repair endonuclease MutL, partial [candidate division WOR-3 bacterium]|nr:DNA mismatch repair endonuclease MutL [candidate division WOR-3 bacterium]
MAEGAEQMKAEVGLQTAEVRPMEDSGRRAVKLLPEETVRRIAAGEVITRPAAAVKELVENSLDAGAKLVRVEVRAGGKSLIRVTDDGAGMTREDARLAIARHATSKIDSIDDLTAIRSFGFRGEALAAIAAVTRMTIETNTDPDQTGTELNSEGGSILELRETARARGTTVTCRSLFYNLPVRQAFLKSENYELRLVVETVRGYAIAHPEVAFELHADERRVLSAPPAGGVRERLQGLYEKRLVEGLVELKVDNPLLSLSGFLSEPTQVRGSYEVQTIFFNGRPVRSRVVVRAVYEGYGPMLGGNNPDFVLLVRTDPARLDVNIHPTKQEVRFADERFLFDFIVEAVRQGLGIRRGEGADAGDFLYQRGFAADDASPSDFWQLHNTYVLAQVATGYVIVDQHAAHERVLFEAIQKGRQAAQPQGLLFPITVELNPDEFEAFERVAEKLGRMGLEAKVFSGRTVVVETIPAGSFMGRDEIRELFAEVVRVGPGQAGIETEL